MEMLLPLSTPSLLPGRASKPGIATRMLLLLHPHSSYCECLSCSELEYVAPPLVLPGAIIASVFLFFVR